MLEKTHIEYDINSFAGCSGSIVLFFDMSQSDSVRPHDHVKAIAVHAETHRAIFNERDDGDDGDGDQGGKKSVHSITRSRYENEGMTLETSKQLWPIEMHECSLI
jgi:hypothetical protein